MRWLGARFTIKRAMLAVAVLALIMGGARIVWLRDAYRKAAAYYAAMFDSRLAIDAHPGLHAAADRAFAVLREAADQVAAMLPKGRRPPSLMMALHIWSIAHGIASLFVKEGPARRKLPMPAEDLLEAGVLLYLQSLGLAGGE